MTLVDPTSGVGYAFGEVLPSAHMTTIANNQPDAIDGVLGGAYTATGQIVVNGYDIHPPIRSGYTIGRDEFEVSVPNGTTATVWSLVVSTADKEVMVKAFVTARDGTADVNGYVVSNMYKVRSSALNNVGSELLETPWEDDATWTVSLTSTSLTIELDGTADATNNTTFTGDVYYRIRSA